MDTGIRDQRGRPRSPQLLPLLVVVMVMVVGPEAAAGDGPVERQQDGFGYSYMIHGYALVDVADYQLVPVNSPCQCRQWCQVSTVCHSVSVMEVAGGGVECRVSHRPINFANITDRPRLNKTKGATHFLFTGSTRWDDLRQTGVTLLLLNSQSWSQCLLRCPSHPSCKVGRLSFCTLAIITTDAILQQAVDFIMSGRKYNVYLERGSVGGAAAWGPSSVPHSATEVNATAFSDNSPDAPQSHFFISKDSTQVFIEGSDGDPSNWCLCMSNPLNLEL